jgi:hypothetical protein
MKELMYSLRGNYICTFLSCFIGCANAQENIPTRTNTADSSVPSYDTREFLQHECRDFRFLLLSIEAVKSMEARSACYFYMRGYSLKKADPGTKSCEISIKGAVTVRDILDTAGMKRWISGQPQIKVISKCSILQSPLSGKMKGPEENENLLRFRVKPGDIILVSTVQ